MTPKTLLAMEVPTAYLDKLDPVIDWHFAIATEAVKDAAYFEWYKNRKACSLTMLDNGMFEEGKPMAPRELLKIALELKPEVVFASDVVGDTMATLNLTQEFVALAKEANLQSTIGFIPQGKDPERVAKCFWKMHRLFGASFYGMSFLNDRQEVIRQIPLVDDTLKEFPQAWYHFLGMYDVGERAGSWTLVPHSVDTIKPFKAAFHGLAVEDAPRGLGKWNTQMVMDPANEALMFRNIAFAHRALGVL